MPQVKIAERKIWVDDQPIPLLSGEMHYWRLDPNSWRVCLERVREMGLDIVATYVCWDFHETTAGKYDFRGESDPRRNLIAFLDLLTEMGFWIILRPGPYIYAEWSNNGVPDHAAKFHRLDPKFLELAQDYMAAVTEVVKPYLATRGGRIILWQADNEIDPWPHFYTEEMGLGQRKGIFHEYLKQQYGDVAALNAAWRTSYTAFEEARAVSEMFTDDPALMSRYNDFRAFQHWYVNQVAAQSVDTYRALGLDVPILLNTYSGVGTQVWAAMEQIGDIVGPDIYPSREFLYRTGEHRHILEAVRYTDSYSRLPYIPEYEAGIWHDWLEDVGTLTPNHYRLLCLSALMEGAAGWNWYMLVNRDNWTQSPINEWGRTRPKLFDVFKQMTALYKQIDPMTLERLTNTAVTFDPLQRATQRPGQDLLQSLYDADIDYDFFDLSQDNGSGRDKPLLFYAGGAWLSEAGQRRLVEYVENGGHLVCIGAYPKLDQHLQPLNLLAFPEPSGIVSGSPEKLNLRLWEGSVQSRFMHLYDHVDGEVIPVERLPVKNRPSEELCLQFDLQVGKHYTIGCSVERGLGRLTVLGISVSPELLVMLHDQFNVSIPTRSHTQDIKTALLQRDHLLYVIVTNAGDEAKSAEIQFAREIIPKGSIVGSDLILKRYTGTLGDLLSVPVGRKDGAIVRLSKPGVPEAKYNLRSAQRSENN
jgi:hypothetical protein